MKGKIIKTIAMTNGQFHRWRNMTLVGQRTIDAIHELLESAIEKRLDREERLWAEIREVMDVTDEGGCEIDWIQRRVILREREKED